MSNGKGERSANPPGRIPRLPDFENRPERSHARPGVRDDEDEHPGEFDEPRLEVRTDMGGPEAERSVEEGDDTAVWLATLPDGGPTSGFFRDRKPVPW